MSQLPPPPVPPGMGHTPPGYPHPKQGNVMATLSLICGILMCIPVVTGVLAIIFGLLGIKRANDPAVNNGKPVAVTGLVLGFLGLILWIGFIALGGKAYLWGKEQLAKPRETTFACLSALAEGEVDKALTFCHPTMDQAELAGVADYLKPMGALRDLSVDDYDFEGGMVTLVGEARFQNGTQAFKSGVTLEDGTWKVGEIEVRPMDPPFFDTD